MTDNPTSEALADVRSYMATARLFRTAEDALDFLAGPAQHDAHVQTYRGELWLRRKEAQYRAANAAVAELVNRMIGERAALATCDICGKRVPADTIWHGIAYGIETFACEECTSPKPYEGSEHDT